MIDFHYEKNEDKIGDIDFNGRIPPIYHQIFKMGTRNIFCHFGPKFSGRLLKPTKNFDKFYVEIFNQSDALIRLPGQPAAE